ncbi:hypothetical protein [Nitrosopumilus sp.]|uniref:hypothetical protein n=1 Tax=Nitrosopumilus sp. TaxID=2024843 RepID=UPI00292FF8BA|nr:hypothetical protein [Nitrosopumilus sp.]
MTGMIEHDAGLINQDTGMINEDTGLMENSTGKIEENTGMITETNDTEYVASGRRKRSRERGKDSKPRNFPLHTIKNLPQFRNKSHQEGRQYILEKKGIDIGSNFRWNSAIMWILIGFVVVAGGIGIWKIYQQHQNKK